MFLPSSNPKAGILGEYFCRGKGLFVLIGILYPGAFQREFWNFKTLKYGGTLPSKAISLANFPDIALT